MAEVNNAFRVECIYLGCAGTIAAIDSTESLLVYAGHRGRRNRNIQTTKLRNVVCHKNGALTALLN